MISIYFQLFFCFFKIGLFGFGGGLAILSIIQNEVVSRGWVSVEEFIDIVSISQITPGPISVNCATYVGYSITHSIWGALLTTIALITPGLLALFGTVLLFSKVQHLYQTNTLYQNTMTYLRFVVIGLIFSAALLLINNDTFPDIKSYMICLSVLILYVVNKLLHTKKNTPNLHFSILTNPIFVIVLSALIGLILYT